MGSYTDNYSLYLPSIGEQGWGDLVNANFTKLDLMLKSGEGIAADKLATARTINGTSFNGTANITTANWGTARNITITDGTNTGIVSSVNGSGNISLRLPTTIRGADLQYSMGAISPDAALTANVSISSSRILVADYGIIYRNLVGHNTYEGTISGNLYSSGPTSGVHKIYFEYKNENETYVTIAVNEGLILYMTNLPIPSNVDLYVGIYSTSRYTVGNNVNTSAATLTVTKTPVNWYRL